MDAIYGCDGCRTTLGRAGCATHRDRPAVAPLYSFRPTHGSHTHAHDGRECREYIVGECFLATQPVPATEASALRETLDTLRDFVKPYSDEVLTHEPTGGQLHGMTVLREGDTHVRFVYDKSDEATLVGLVRALLAATPQDPETPETP